MRIIFTCVTVGLVAAITGQCTVVPSLSRSRRSLMQPYFDGHVTRNVTTIVGQSAYLTCRVRQVGDKAVSWLRTHDLHVLTSGVHTFTGDERFQVIHPDKSENWTLQVKFAQKRDAGVYYCQVNTEPRILLSFHLEVIEARAKLLGPATLYVKKGSTITLVCVVPEASSEHSHMFWYHEGSIVDYSGTRGGITINPDKTKMARSTLRIRTAQESDSGNYTCVPTIETVAGGASVMVHVINGEHPAAMQHGDSAVSALYCVASVTRWQLR